ncbi:hypothetical protein H5410_019965 [Solanum commersonii]|uniref:Uncharacterized protein n=1 Tax=Solanum commersonii TaxID=4109 RepID=A0A9J5ZB42_SOLCO|nr:hypothetical protein H5410_019965 [Solanum commersonii]
MEVGKQWCFSYQVFSEKLLVRVEEGFPLSSRERNFNYFGSFIYGNGEIDNDVTHHIGAMGKISRLASRVLCDEKVLSKLKTDFVVWVAFWSVKNSHAKKMQVAKMRMLRWMCEHMMKRCEKLDIVGSRRGRGRPKKYWGEGRRLVGSGALSCFSIGLGLVVDWCTMSVVVLVLFM